MTAGRQKRKLRMAVFDFGCCEGCQLTLLRLNEKLFSLLEHVEIVAWREVMTGKKSEYDLALCEGSIIFRHDIERINSIRDNAEILVALGSCAAIGCHNELKTEKPVDHLREAVYGMPDYPGDVIRARPITAVVPVDYQILGCPASMPEIVDVFKHILTGQEYELPNQPVCVECKFNDNLCVLEKGQMCLGPVTRCGCDAICTGYGDTCRGCRGLTDQANTQAMSRALGSADLHSIMRRVKELHPLYAEDIRLKISVYNNRSKPEKIKHEKD